MLSGANFPKKGNANIYEYVHKTLKGWAEEQGIEIDLISWNKEPQEIIDEIQSIIEDAVLDLEFELQMMLEAEVAREN